MELDEKVIAIALALATVVIATVTYPGFHKVSSTGPKGDKTYVPLPEPAQKITVVPVTPNKPPRQSPIFPPEEFDHWYQGDLTIRIVATVEELFERCHLRAPTNDPKMILACAMTYPDNCIIYMLPDETMRKNGWNTGLLLRHEIGHCNGWPGTHPGERAVTWPSTLYVQPSVRRGY